VHVSKRTRPAQQFMWTALAFFALIGSMSLARASFHHVPVAGPETAFVVRHYSLTSGLPQSSVYDMVSLNGFLILSGQGYICRYDGATFERLIPEADSPQTFARLLARKDGTIWAGTTRFGVFRIHDGQAEPVAHIPENANVKDLLEDEAGRVWVLTRDQGVYRVEGNRVTSLGKPPGPSDTRLFTMVELPAGIFLVGTSRGLFRLAEDRWEKVPTFPDISVFCLYQDSSRSLFAGTENGLWTTVHGRWKPVPPSRRTSSFHVYDIVHYRHSLICCSSNGLYLFQNGELAPIGHPGLPTTDVGHCLQSDYEGNIWLGTDAQGLYMLRRSIFHPVPLTSNGTTQPCVYSLMEDHEGALWVGSDGVTIVRPDGTIRKPFSRTVGNRRVYAILEENDSSIWLACHPGLYRVEKRKPSGYNVQLVDDQITAPALAMDQEGRVYAGTMGNGIIVWDSHKARVISSVDGLPTDHFLSVVVRRNGNLLFGSTEGHLLELTPGRSPSWSLLHHFPTAWITGLLEAEDGSVWAGVEGRGVYHIQNNGNVTHITERHGLASNRVSFLKAIEDQILIGTANGATLVTKDGYLTFTEDDGLPSQEVNFNAIVFSKHTATGWIGTVNGLATFRTADLRLGEIPSPPVRFLSAQVTPSSDPPSDWLPPPAGNGNQNAHPFDEASTQREGRARELIENIAVPWNWNNAEFQFQAASFSASRRLLYRYRLHGLTASWATSRTERVSFRNLPPGDYTFEVYARNRFGRWSTKPGAIRFSIKAAWWQTAWFRFLVFVLGATILSVLYKAMLVVFRMWREYRRRTMLGPYRLERFLGKGALSEVFSATYVPNKSPVALKVMDATNIPATREKEISREMEICRSLHHPNVIRLIEHGRVKDRFYIAMEHIKGPSLRQVMRTDSLITDPIPALTIAQVLFETIQYLHRNRIVHCDLKPENIMFRSRDFQLSGTRPHLLTEIRTNVVIVDFGISKHMDKHVRTQRLLDSGTPLYIPPEAFLGREFEYPTIDLYAIGIMLYELLAGQHPYPASTGDIYQTICELLYSRPTPLVQLRSDLPDDVSRFVMSLIEPDTTKRLRELAPIIKEVKILLNTWQTKPD